MLVKREKGGGVVTRGQELDLCSGSQQQMGPWREGLSGGKWNNGEDKVNVGDTIENREKRKYAGFFLSPILQSSI